MTSLIQGKTVYDYSVYIDDGKLAILQINLTEGRLYIYQRGAIMRSHSLLLLPRFSSTQLTLQLDFLEGNLEVELESVTDKLAIFELLSLVLDTEADENISGLPALRKTGNLQKNGNLGTESTWNRQLVEVYYGYFTCYLPEKKTPEVVVDLWANTCSVQQLDDRSFSVTVSGKNYSFRLCDEDKSEVREWIQCFSAARRRARRLTEKDIAAAVLGTDEEDDQIGDTSSQQDDNGEEDVVDAALQDPDLPDGDVEAQGAMFLSFLPWRRRMKTRPRKPTEDEEFVMIELEDVLRGRAEQLERSTKEESGDKVQDQHEELSKDEGQKNLTVPAKTTEVEKGETKASEDMLIKLTPSIPCPAPPSSGLPPPPPPPPPPSSSLAPNKQNIGIKLTEVPNCALKQAHWSKVSSARVENSLWSNVEDVSSNLHLKDLEQHFFIKENTNTVVPNRGSTDSTRRTAVLLLDQKRAQILGIVFKRPYDRILDRLCDAIASTTEIDVFNIDKLKAMKQLVPTADDRELYKMQTREKLLPVDRFMKDLCEVQELGLRLDLAINVITLPRRLEELRERISDVTKACKEVTSGGAFRDLLISVRNTGNYLNAKRNGGYGVQGFHITSVEKVLDIKNTDSGFTVLDFLVKEFQRSNEKLLKWTETLKHVPVCSEICVIALQAEVNAMKAELTKRREEVNKLEEIKWRYREKKYFSDVKSFLSSQEVEVSSLSEKYSSLKNKYTTMLDYLGEATERKSGEVFSAIADFMRKFDNARSNLRT